MKPVRNKLQLDVKHATIAGHKTDTIEEVAEVIAVGPEVKDFKKGDFVVFKAWACDIISHNGEKFYFISEDSDALCATK